MCTEFCLSNCDGEHHAILNALTRVKDKSSFATFRQLLRAYQIHGFRLDTAVPDPHPDFRYPLLHWAVVLGKTGVVKMLLNPPFNVNPKLKSSANETALHRLLNFMDDGNPNLSRILETTTLLKHSLTCEDDEKKTPLHICADILASCQKKELEIWKQVFNTMVDLAENKQEILKYHDNEGDTVLHTLSKREELVDLVEYVVYIGASFQVKNNARETPIEVSWRFSMPTYNLYLMLKSTLNYVESSESESSEIRTRATAGLSETKDYTKFFEEEIKSNRSDDGDIDEDYETGNTDDSSSSSSDNRSEDSLQRRVSEMSVSISNRLEELSSSDSENIIKNCRRRRGRSLRKRPRISDTSSDISDLCGEENSNKKFIKLSSNKSNGNEYKERRSQVKLRNKNSPKTKCEIPFKNCINEDNIKKESNVAKESNISWDQHKKTTVTEEKRYTEIKQHLLDVGVTLESRTMVHEKRLSAGQLRKRIFTAIRGIRELFEDDGIDSDSK